MFLAIKGSVDAVFKLQKPDVPTIEKYLFDIPHEILRTKKRHINKVYKKIPFTKAINPVAFRVVHNCYYKKDFSHLLHLDLYKVRKITAKMCNSVAIRVVYQQML